MKLSLAKKLHNRDEVLIKKSLLGEMQSAQVLNSRLGDSKSIILFDVLLPNGSILLDVPHKMLK